jgi:hypothetical protein
MPTPRFELRFLSGIVWILCVIGASIVYRRLRGKPLFPRTPEGALFHESAASGNSNRNVFTKLGGANNCLRVSVLADDLVVVPHFPFNLMFLPEIYGLEHRIRRLDIRSIEEKKTLGIWKFVEIRFVDETGGDQSLNLRLRDQPGFLKALGRAPSNP